MTSEKFEEIRAMKVSEAIMTTCEELKREFSIEDSSTRVMFGLALLTIPIGGLLFAVEHYSHMGLFRSIVSGCMLAALVTIGLPTIFFAAVFLAVVTAKIASRTGKRLNDPGAGGMLLIMLYCGLLLAVISEVPVIGPMLSHVLARVSD